MKRKILILASWYPSDSSPLNGIFVQEQASVLSQVYDVAVLVPQTFHWRLEFLRTNQGLGSQVEQREGLNIYREHALTALSRIPALSYWIYEKATKRGFKTLLNTWGRPDLIHAHIVLPGGWAATKLSKRYGIPVVLTEHSGPFSIQLQTRYQQHLVRRTLEQVDRIVAVSPALAQQISAFYKVVELDTIGNLIKTHFFIPLENSNEKSHSITRFLSIALLTEHKGMKYLLEAAQHLYQRGHTAFEVIIGGDGSARTELEQMAKAMRLSSHCHFLGLLSRIEVKYWMQQCDVFVLPSLHETFGIVIGEAMACGKPVISTRCGGPEFVVTQDTGVLVDVADSVSLADVMEKFILGQLKFKPHLIRQSVVKRFGEEAFLENLSLVYEEIWSKE